MKRECCLQVSVKRECCSQVSMKRECFLQVSMKCECCLQVSMKRECCLQVYSNTKFHENSSSRRLVIPGGRKDGRRDGQTDRHDAAYSGFLQLCDSD